MMSNTRFKGTHEPAAIVCFDELKCLNPDFRLREGPSTWSSTLEGPHCLVSEIAPVNSPGCPVGNTSPVILFCVVLTGTVLAADFL